jgi:hypothetical protein
MSEPTRVPMSHKLSLCLGGYVLTVVFGWGWFAVFIAWKWQ